MRFLFFFAGLVAFLTWAAFQVNQVTAEPIPTTGVVEVAVPNGSVFLSLDADGRAVVTTGEVAQRQPRGTFSTHSALDHSKRLAHLREVNKPPPPPPAPLVELNVVQQNTTVVERTRRHNGYHRDLRIDRRVHDRRQRVARQGYSTPLPGITSPGRERPRGPE